MRLVRNTAASAIKVVLHIVGGQISLSHSDETGPMQTSHIAKSCHGFQTKRHTVPGHRPYQLVFRSHPVIVDSSLLNLDCWQLSSCRKDSETILDYSKHSNLPCKHALMANGAVQDLTFNQVSKRKIPKSNQDFIIPCETRHKATKSSQFLYNRANDILDTGPLRAVY